MTRFAVAGKWVACCFAGSSPRPSLSSSVASAASPRPDCVRNRRRDTAAKSSSMAILGATQRDAPSMILMQRPTREETEMPDTPARGGDIRLSADRPHGLPFLQPLYGPPPYQYTDDVVLMIVYEAAEAAVREV